MGCITRYAERLSSYLKSGYDKELSASNQVFLQAHRGDIAKALDGFTGEIASRKDTEFRVDCLKDNKTFYYKWSYIRTFTTILCVISTVALAVFVSVTAAGIAAAVTTGAVFWLTRKINQSKTWINFYNAFEVQESIFKKYFPIKGLLNTDREKETFSTFIKEYLPTNRNQIVDLYVNSTDHKIKAFITNLANFIKNKWTVNGLGLNKELVDKLEWVRYNPGVFQYVFNVTLE